jgi:ribose-phosphate pyrophosphokinase
LKIIPGPASKELGEKLAEHLHAETVPVFLKTFPDGESYIRFETQSLKNEDVVIVQTTSPPQDQRLIQLLLMADNAKDMEARSITAVVPYFAYGRQDKRFLPGEAFSAKTIVRALENCGVNRIITINAHNPTILKNFNIPIQDLSAIPLLAEYFKTNKLVQSPLSLSMGKKAVGVAQEADNVLHGGYDYVASKRDAVTGNVTLEGGRKVYVACVHPLLMGDSYKRIIENGAEEIIGTDAVQSPVSKVSIAPLVGKVLMQKGA